MTKTLLTLTILLSSLLILWPRSKRISSEAPSKKEPATIIKSKLQTVPAVTSTPEHDEALVEKLLIHAETNPTEAAQVLLDTTSPGRLKQTTLLGILQRLALRDPATAYTWARTFPEPQREEALLELERLTKKLAPISPLQ